MVFDEREDYAGVLRKKSTMPQAKTLLLRRLEITPSDTPGKVMVRRGKIIHQWRYHDLNAVIEEAIGVAVDLCGEHRLDVVGVATKAVGKVIVSKEMFRAVCKTKSVQITRYYGDYPVQSSVPL